MNSSTPLSPYLDLSVVIRALRGAVGGWTVRGLLSDVLALLLNRRLGEVYQKMQRLVEGRHKFLEIPTQEFRVNCAIISPR